MSGIQGFCFQTRYVVHLLVFHASYVIVHFLLRFSTISKCCNYIDNEINYLDRDYYMEKSPNLEVNSHSPSQEDPCLLWNLKS
jgi:hypothetical protein